MIGYDESPGTQTGSHNLVLGTNQKFTSYGAILGGSHNSATGPHSAVLGYHNTAAGTRATATGGLYNSAASAYSAISGGRLGVTSAYTLDQRRLRQPRDQPVRLGGRRMSQPRGCGHAHHRRLLPDRRFVPRGERRLREHRQRRDVVGERRGRAEATDRSAVVSGGYANTASGWWSAVSGGSEHIAAGNDSAISGGRGNDTTSNSRWSSVSGGISNVASGYSASVSGGSQNTASGNDASISGGNLNRATNRAASVSGGCANLAGAGAGLRRHRAVLHERDLRRGSVPVRRAVASRTSRAGATRRSPAAAFGISSGNYTAILGGRANDATVEGASVSGGQDNVAGGYASSILGGLSQSLTGNWTTYPVGP